jgi:aquaporin Z
MAKPAGVQAPAPQPMTGGWHPAEWAAEFLGTGLLVLFGVSWVTLDFDPHLPVAQSLHSVSARLLITGLLFPAAGSLYALSPPGRRSGAHLNPAVTFGFWLQRHVHRHDLVGYVVAQCAGAVGGAGLARLFWGPAVAAAPVFVAVTRPGHSTGPAEAVLVEAAMTAALVLLIYGLVSHPATARLTPFAVWALIAVLVWQVAPYTGTSLNPARTLGSDALAAWFPSYWIYVVGPIGGAALGSAGWLLFARRATLTAKLFHDPHYRSTMRTVLPAMPAESGSVSARTG